MKTLYNHILNTLDESVLDISDISTDKATDDILKYEIYNWVNDSNAWKVRGTSLKIKGFDSYIKEIGKDDKGFYIDTKGDVWICLMGRVDLVDFTCLYPEGASPKAFYMKNHKGCPRFRWRKHDGRLIVPEDMCNLGSLEGLPEEIGLLYIGKGTGQKSVYIGERNIEKLEIQRYGPVILRGNSKTKVKELDYELDNRRYVRCEGFTPKKIQKN